MEKQDRKLLIEDISARLPYGVYVEHVNSGFRSTLHNVVIFPRYDKNSIHDYEFSVDFFGDGDWLDISEFKPYLYPLSSMTEEQEMELEKIDPEYYTVIYDDGSVDVSSSIKVYDWLNKNHFDYRGLIEKGLANNATNKNVY